jgi:hypothetical protein
MGLILDKMENVGTVWFSLRQGLKAVSKSLTRQANLRGTSGTSAFYFFTGFNSTF